MIDEIFADRVRPIIPEQIKDRKLCIIGCGSGGSMLAVLMAKCSVPHITLVDGEDLDLGNTCRHVLNPKDVGKKKVDALADYLREINPNITVNSHAIHTTDDTDLIDSLFAGHDVIAACTDDFGAQLFLNEFALYHKKPITFGTCTSGATGGKAILVEPDGPLGCLNCSEGLNGSIYAKHDPGEAQQYGEYVPNPALMLFIHRTVCDQAWLTLYALVANLEGSHLLRPPGPYMASNFEELRNDHGRLIARANSNLVDYPPIHPDCHYCKETGRITN